MRVGVIRGDLPGPIFIADLEPASQTDSPVEPPGQTRYITRPNATNIAAYLAAQGLNASATALITACVPIGGPVDVSSNTIKAVSGLGSASAPQVTALQDLMAPRFIETQVAIQSFQVGNLAGYLLASYTPDPNRLPALATGAAIAVVEDDGVTAFSSASTAPKPHISSASIGGGNLTISGSGLGNSEYTDETKVKLTVPSTGVSYTVTQKAIVHAGGSVAATSIVIPTSLFPVLPASTYPVIVKFATLASNSVNIS